MKLKRKDIPAQRRKHILDVAKALFARSGYHGVTVDDIASWAGISKGNLYWYFKSKQEIFNTLYEDIIDQFTEPFESIIDSDVSPQEKLRSIVLSHLETAEANPDAISIMFQIAGQQEMNDIITSGYSLWMNNYIAILTPIFTELGENRPEDVATLFAIIVDGLMGLVAMRSDVYNKEKILAIIDDRFIKSGGKNEGK